MNTVWECFALENHMIEKGYATINHDSNFKGLHPLFSSLATIIAPWPSFCGDYSFANTLSTPHCIAAQSINGAQGIQYVFAGRTNYWTEYTIPSNIPGAWDVTTLCYS